MAVNLPCVGRWHGALVAVKVVEHIGSSCIAERIEREAALAVSVSHPNVVSGRGVLE